MASLNETEVQDLYTFAIDLARKAGRAIVDGSSRRFSTPASASSFDHKKNTADLVTETDQAVEALVKKEISTKYPHHNFIGEESWAAGEENGIPDNGVVWIVDPIDGTTNFVHAFPYTCISIGIVVDKVTTIGVVYAPFMDTLYHAAKGKGAYISSPHFQTPRKLPLTDPAPLENINQALVAFEWGSDRRSEILSKKLSSFAKITGDPTGGVIGGKMAQGVRSLGSAALNFCHVASGNLDLYWEIGCWAWDVCAGVVIAQEAGAAVVGSQKHANEVIDDQGTEQDAKFNLVTTQVLTGRKYVVVRAIDGQNKSNNVKAQKHLLKEFYSCVDEWDP
ncbi:related to quinic acid utilisation protein QUTG (inositol-1(or 4)-monophosphatase) [Melanopsichium pennsylvanicum]|uniref:Inositol-1-monophosphatase n=2 Tax=Melanopsichium pennsylvanicum TaxID=63383 RepID=A0AAJ4XLS2_9BASI|nr:related to quinic acid utilisation protein QUTG (inositol-1(or 4)-monophosphatase) [Melanopsichium pennsylvanicum 4]SNX84483.1 related to quinic acid utilisation protein QUTG (inositol-1(or 4)-monophosphatase) [Melanopsichium pennsylvanicum]